MPTFTPAQSSYDVIIIGAGIIGAATALELSRKGFKTLNVDSLPASGYGSTSNSCAIIRTHYSTLEGTALAHEGYFYWANWADYLGVEDERGYAKFINNGCMVMKTQSNDSLANVIAHQRALGIPFEEWGPSEITAKLPMFSLQKFAPAKAFNSPGFAQPTGGEVPGGVFFERAGYINDPQLATHNLQRAAEAAGAEFRFNAKVQEIPQVSGRVTGVTLQDGTVLSAPVVVNVAGPHSYIINEMVGATADMTIKTRALRQEVTHLPAPEGVQWDRDGIVTSDSDISVYSRPEQGNYILVGSEDPECDEREWVDPDDFNRDFTDQWTAQAHRMGQRIPTLGVTAQRRGVVDLYDVSDDWIPIYDKSCVDGFYMAIGTSGNQFKNAPIAGLMMATLIELCENGRDHDVDPVVVHGAYTARDLQTGFFSRKRTINPDSSFSVLG
jgi:sarcosine oxidase, subunit beta